MSLFSSDVLPYAEMIDQMFRQIGQERFAAGSVSLIPIQTDHEDETQCESLGVMYLYQTSHWSLQVLATVGKSNLVDLDNLDTIPTENTTWVDTYKLHPDQLIEEQIRTLVPMLEAKGFRTEKVFQASLEGEESYSFPNALFGNDDGHTVLIASSPIQQQQLAGATA